MKANFDRILFVSLAAVTISLLVSPLTTACKPRSMKSEIAYLRQLAAAGDIDRLAKVLDTSMVLIPAGVFTLGSEQGDYDERPQRQVYLDAYKIDRFEVTNAQYRRFVLAAGVRTPQHWTGSEYPAGQADSPVTGVSWSEASAYCEWVGKRLPSEAEWEKACRGPDMYIFPWGNMWDPERANTGIECSARWPPTVEAIWQLLEADLPGDACPHPMPVGSLPQGASTYGVLDMAGNATEWVLDWYNWQGYEDLPGRNPVGSGPPWNHAVRGSAWTDKQGEQHLVEDLSRCSKRNSSHTSNDPRLGFRCARPLE